VLTGWALCCGVWAGAACALTLPAPRRAGPGWRPRTRLRPGPGWRPGPVTAALTARWRARADTGPASAEALTAVTERLAALSRAGVVPQRAWQVLAATGGSGSGPARVVAGMLAGGGSVAEGLRLAAVRPGADRRLLWLALAYEVADRSGAPASAVLDRFAELVRAEVAREQERSVALAGPRATATLLSVLPLVAPLLGRLLGAHPWHTLVGTVPGRICLVTGAGFWLAGRWWTVRLVDRAARAGR
jgi:tight adherence protein B